MECAVKRFSEVAATVITATILIMAFGSYTESRSLQKRNLFQLCSLVSMYTDFSCWDLNDYGCFCGYGQEGRKPVDEIDTCCERHDRCYHSVRCYFSAQFITFNMDCQNGTCRCTDRNPCLRDVCQCEVGLAECMRGKMINDMYRRYNRTKCVL